MPIGNNVHPRIKDVSLRPPFGGLSPPARSRPSLSEGESAFLDVKGRLRRRHRGCERVRVMTATTRGFSALQAVRYMDVPAKKRSHAFAAAVPAAILASLALVAMAPAQQSENAARAAEATPLTPQTCNTECQRRFTDCLHSCDGNQPCMRQCISSVEQCVTQCVPPTPPISPTPTGAPSTPPTSAPSAPSAPTAG